MNKSAIQRFAIWARTELIAQVSQRAYQYGITKGGYGEANAVTVGGRALSMDEQRQRKELVQQIQQKNYTQVMEEVAYTWFNRFIALRFMEVNNYLPSHIRVFSDSTGAFKPEILNDVLHLELPGLNADKVAEYIENNQTDDLYRYLLLTQCNALNEALPRMFERMGGYTELLLPNNILKQDGILGRMVMDIPEEDWTDQVQIIGWLYQYYNTELKDDTFALLKKNVKITKERIPSATQLFTPDWIVRYMVENSLGRIFISEKCSVDSAQLTEQERITKEKAIAEEMGWKYYLPEAEQEPEVRKQLNSLTTDHSTLTSIKLIDPCMGSGHILVYAFDVLMDIYTQSGWNERDAAQSILKNNLYGLDIDDRAAQLAYFAVMMKARQYDRRIFSRGIQPHVYAIVESNGLDSSTVDYFTNNDPKLQKDFATLREELHDAKEYGSILNISQVDFAALYARVEEVSHDMGILHDTAMKSSILPLIQVAETMAQKYDVVVTNPPYMGSSGMSSKLQDFVKKHFPFTKTDMSTIFMEKTIQMCSSNGFMAMINIPVWMFITSYEQMRELILTSNSIRNMVHCGRGIFGSDFGTTSFVIGKKYVKGFSGSYLRLFDKTGAVDSVDTKEQWFFDRKGYSKSCQDRYLSIPGYPIAYWVSDRFIDNFIFGKAIGDICPVKKGMDTSNNDKFLRFWHEISTSNFSFGNADSNYKWYPYDKGGDFRRWFGNKEYVVDFEHDGAALEASPANLRSRHLYFKRHLTWSALTASSTSFRYSEHLGMFDSAGSSMFPNDEDMTYFLGLMNSCVFTAIMNVINPTINYGAGSVSQVPVIRRNEGEVQSLVRENIEFSRHDWDSFETSWDFKKHPLVVRSEQWSVDSSNHSTLTTNHYAAWQAECEARFNQLKSNEEELNRIFIDIYGLQDELTPDVEEKDVTVRKADLQRDICSLISYAVGCMFGRYSLDVDGLAFAGGEFSDEWVVVSGQYYLRSEVERLVDNELQRVNSMAESNGLGDGNISVNKMSSERRNVCIVGSDEKIGDIDSIKYSRGTGTKLYEGICELPFNSKGLESGIGNTAYDLCSPEILNAISSGTGDELVARGWKDANRIDWKAIHSALITNHYCPDRDNIIPICDDEYFDDDIVGRFVKWVETVYGKETLEENLKFIADALGGKGTPREVIRNYFLNDFYADHLKIYQKRPIYWLFDSGKKNGFKALIYMHRYQSDLLARMRTDYVHEQQERYRTQLMHIADAIDHASASERVKLTKQQKKIQDQALEIQKYEEKIHHLADQNIQIDLDDGVKHNYELFTDVLAKIK